jgi:hypothetical protein
MGNKLTSPSLAVKKKDFAALGAEEGDTQAGNLCYPEPGGTKSTG